MKRLVEAEVQEIRVGARGHRCLEPEYQKEQETNADNQQDVQQNRRPQAQTKSLHPERGQDRQHETDAQEHQVEVAPEVQVGMEEVAEAELATGADIVHDPSDLPDPIGGRASQTVQVDLEAVEVVGQLADGATYTYFTFNGSVPGPFIRVREGDTIELTLSNSDGSQFPHSIDLHAVNGPGGGAVYTQTNPGG